MRFTFILLMLIAWVFTSPAQQIVQTYDFKSYQLENQQNHSILKIEGTRNLAKPGNPMQPYYLSNILLPPGAEVTSAGVKVLSKKNIQLPHDLMPMQYPRPVSADQENDFVKNQTVYQKSKVLDIQKSIIIDQNRMNGYDIAQIKFSPIVYNARNNTVEIATKVQLLINYEKNGKGAVKMLSARPEINKKLNALCENTAMRNQYQSPKTSGEIIDALIITPEEFIPDFANLINDYKARGISTATLSMETIETDISGTDIQAKIRNAITEYYQQHNTLYVLLGGDVEHIPYRGFYCEVQSSSVYEDDDIPADLYYMALDGTWNDDGDAYFAEPEEDDLLPEIALSRMPFTTHEELEKMLNKTQMYTNEPVTGELNNPLLAGEHLYDNPLTWGAQYLDLIHGTHSDNGYTTTGIPESHPFDTMYDRNSQWSSSELIAEINSGHPFIHHVGHSNTNYAMRLYSSDITNDNFAEVDGISHNFPLIYTHGCICGAFDADDCIAEAMLQIDNFAVAFVGNSRYGWFNEGQTEGPSQHIHREFVSALYGDSLSSLAEAHMMSKIETSGWVEAPDQHEPGALRWCFYDCNALGEPALPIWTNDPRDIDVTVTGNVYIGESTITAQVTEDGQPAGNIKIAVLRNGNLYGAAASDSTGLAEITLSAPFTTPGEIKIVSSGYNVVKDTLTKTLERPQEGYLVVADVLLGDDNQPVYGHTYQAGLQVENVGESTSNSTIINISTDNPMVTLENASATIDPVDALQAANYSEMFTLHINDTIADGTPIQLHFEFTENGEVTHTMNKTLIARAPMLTWNNIGLTDSIAGNNNGIFEPGEIVNITAQLANKGSIAPANIKAFITDLSGSALMLNDTVILHPDTSAMEMNIEYALQADTENTAENYISFNLEGFYDNYILETKSYGCMMGQALENFETGDFTKYDWQNNSVNPWQIDSENAWEGDYCSASHDIDDDESSEISITVDVPEDDTISFMYKVSCEDASGSTLWDYLEFTIDGNSMDTWDGEKDWEQANYAVDAGTHTFKWTYSKDYTISEGDDCAWIDNIILPIPGYTPPADNLPPEIISGNQLELVTGENFTHDIQATDPEDDPLTASAVLAPEWVVFDSAGAGTWHMNGTTPAALATIPDIVIAVGDGFQYTSQVMQTSVDGVSIESNSLVNESATIYPLPARDKLHVQLLGKNLQAIRLLTIDGKTRFMQQFSNGKKIYTHTLNLGNISPGIYMLNIRTQQGEIINRKVIIQP